MKNLLLKTLLARYRKINYWNFFYLPFFRLFIFLHTWVKILKTCGNYIAPIDDQEKFITKQKTYNYMKERNTDHILLGKKP